MADNTKRPSGSPAGSPAVAPASARPDPADSLAVWARIGLLSFGGPPAQIALMHRSLVIERRWISEQDYLGALSFCMLLPGPEAMQLATYVGWRRGGVAGGLLAGVLFVAPGAAIILALAAVYAAAGDVPLVRAVFAGVQAAVVMIVIEALVRVARRALRRPAHQVVAAVSFLALFAAAVPYPLVIVAAAVVGALCATAVPADHPAVAASGRLPPGQLRRSAATAALWAGLWLVPLAVLTAWVGPGHVLSQIGWFFSKLAVVTFGGAYAVLAYMAQDVVAGHGWLDAGQMVDALGLAETTPGPLILVTEFVGFLAATGQSGGDWTVGLAGAAVALWVTFVPCFLWIFVGAPYIAWMQGRPRLTGALSGITAAVVGVIAHLALWFGLHVLFGRVETVGIGPLAVMLPDGTSLDWRAAALTLLAGLLLLGRHWPIPAVLGACAALAAVWDPGMAA